MTPRRLGDLPRAERRRAIAASTARCALASAAVIGLYYVLPLDRRPADAAAVIRLVLGGLVFLAVMGFELHRILNAELPQLRAVETLAVTLPLFVVLFAGAYVSLSTMDPTTFTEPLDHTSGLYFTIVTLGTVGYGDIAPTSDFARILVSLQVLVDLAFVALAIRLLVTVTRISLNRGTPHPPDEGPDPDPR
ncbi:potassium channel family protein [Streptacidiphilus carbonis]|uniref:potassium channel family protein n=1 Tax=Streptacidiphilus carbonis TaxID=105422 RepID=UPI0007C7EF85|nr:potassium channel family protein [Streptacidiphilus carbonis]